MPDRILIKKMVLFLRDARDEWTRLADESESLGKADDSQRALNQQRHCEREIARLLADLPENERSF